MIMRRIWQEIRRIAADAPLWCMVAVALGINGGLIFLDRTPVALYHETEAAIALAGAKITEEALVTLEEQYANILEKANTEYLARFGERTEDIQELFELNYLKESEYYRLLVWRSLIAAGRFRISCASSARGEILYFNAALTTPLLDQLYGKLLPAICLEALAVAFYAIFRTREQEYVFRTSQVVYCTGRGRSLEHDKQVACGCILTGILLLVSTVSLFAFFCSFPHPSTLAVPYSAWVYPGAQTHFSIRGDHHILLILTVMLWGIQLIALMAGGSGLLTKSAYGGPLLFLLFLGCLGVLQWYCEDGKNLQDFLLSWNPLSLLLTIRQTEEGMVSVQFRLEELFCYSTECYGAPFYEVGVLITWTVISGVFYWISGNTFQRRELSE